MGTSHNKADTPDKASLVVDLGEFSGPLDLLLTLAREHKIDLTKLSLATLADQYLAFIQKIREANLSIAAEYLVMATWLTWLKSRLLLPPEEQDESEESADQIARRLADRLRHMEAIGKAAARLDRLPHLGRDVFTRPHSELPTHTRIIPHASLYDLLHGYSAVCGRGKPKVFTAQKHSLDDPRDAAQRLVRILSGHHSWHSITGLLPQSKADTLYRRSTVAATFVAALELYRRGLIQLRQKNLSAPLFLRKGSAKDRKAPHPDAA